MEKKMALIIVATASFVLMVIEIVAGRIMAPSLGVSLYTWTSIIGMVLTGITVGNFLGGKIADRSPSISVLGLVFLMAAVATAGINYWATIFVYGGAQGFWQGFPLLYATLLYSFVVFFPPALFLSMVTPMVVKLSLKSLKDTGSTVGMIYASSAFGSILGTFAAGYWLLAWFGTRFLIGAIAAILALVGIWLMGKWRFKMTTLVMFILFLGISFWLPVPCDVESNYYCLKIKPIEDSSGKILQLDHLVHSYVYADEAGNVDSFGYEYERLFALLVASEREAEEEFSTFTIGGGGYVGPRYLEEAYPNSEIVVAEIDPAVTEIARNELGFRPDSRVEVHHGDARQYLDRLEPDKKFDYIFTDAFNDLSVPYHLVTTEFTKTLKAHLNDEGVYAANIIDGYEEGRFVTSYVKTLKEHFDHIYLLPTSERWKDAPRSTYVIMASDRPLFTDGALTGVELPIRMGEWDELENDLKQQLTYVVPQEDMNEFIASRESIVLTDDYVPVENMLAPLFDGQYR